MNRLGKFWVILAVVWSVTGCDVAMGEDLQRVQEGADSGAGPTPEVRGLLGFGEAGAVEGVFGHDLETHAWIFEAPRGAVVELVLGAPLGGGGAMVVTALDANLSVFGPQRVDGGFGTVPIGHDDDSGGERRPLLEQLLLPAGGRAGEAAVWLVVVGTNEDRGRGGYRLGLRCTGGACDTTATAVSEAGAAPATCPEGLGRDIIGCLSGLPHVDLSAPWGLSFEQGLAVCSSEGRAAAWCRRRMGGCGLDTAPLVDLCGQFVRTRLLDGACVFGRRFGEALEGQEGVLLTGAVTLRDPAALGDLDRARLGWLSVLLATEGPDALLRGNGGVIRHELWDAASRAPLEALTVAGPRGASGAIFHADSEAMAAEVRDGLIVGCNLRFGPERRRCARPEDCAAGLRCVGVAGAWGRCIDSLADVQKGRDQPCSADSECGDGEGLVCAGLGLQSHGRCVPAWQRARFIAESGGEIPDGDVAGQAVDILAFGLPGGVGDLRLMLEVEHPRIRDLRVTLENQDHGGPAGWGERVVFAGERDGDRLVLDWASLGRIGRDQPATGRWRVRVQDLVTGARGHIVRAGVEVTSL
jgi:hypothetical protein